MAASSSSGRLDSIPVMTSSPFAKLCSSKSV